MTRIRHTTRLTIVVLLVVLCMDVRWNLEPVSIHLLQNADGRFRYKIVGPGWPISSFEYEFERQTAGIDSSDLMTRTIVANTAAWVTNVSLAAGLFLCLIANIRRAVQEARAPRPGT